MGNCWVEEASPGQKHCPETNTLKVGQDSANARKRTLLRFGGIGTIPNGVTIGYAELQLNLNSQMSANTNEADYAVNLAGKRITDNATWNRSNKDDPATAWTGGDPQTPAYDPKTINGAVAGPWKWNITGLVSGWYTNSLDNNGLVLKQKPEAVNNTLSFTSTAGAADKAPKLTVTYGNAPGVPVVNLTTCTGACSTWSTDTATPTFTAAASDSDSAELKYFFEVRKAGVSGVIAQGYTASMPQGTSASWVVPVGGIPAAGSYEVRATAVDRYGNQDVNGPASAWQPFTVTLAGSTPTVFENSADVTDHLVWTQAGSPYVLEPGVELDIRPQGSLTMKPGTVVKLGAGSVIRIQGSRLEAIGSENRPIVWTSINDNAVMGTANGSTGNPLPGNYRGVEIYDDNGTGDPSTAKIRNVAAWFGGYGTDVLDCHSTDAVVEVRDDSRLIVERSEFMFNQIAGVSVGGDAEAHISGSRFAYNECGVRLGGANVLGVHGPSGFVENNVFEPTSGGIGLSNDTGEGPVEISGNWMYADIAEGSAYSGLKVLFDFERSDYDLHDNAILGFHWGRSPGDGDERLDLRYNWWGPDLPPPSGCWLGTWTELNYSAPKLANTDEDDPDCPAIVGSTAGGDEVTGYADDVLPFSGPPPFPDAGLEANPAQQSAIEALLGSSNEFGNRGDGEQADPVNSLTGNYIDHVVDAAMPALGLPIVAERTYNSLATAANAGVLGQGWSMSYQEQLKLDFTTSPATAVFVSAEGQQITYTKENGAWTAAKNITATLTDAPNSDGYILTTREQLEYRFSPTGLLQSIKDRNGHGAKITERDGSNRVKTVANVKTDGTDGTRTLAFAYDNGLLDTITLPDGRYVDYNYDNGQLSSVRALDGRRTLYSYQDHRLVLEQLLKGPLGTVPQQVVRLEYGAATDINNKDRVVKQWNARDRLTTFAWDPVSQRSTMTDPREKTWVDDYEDSVLAQRIDPLNRRWSYFYDAKLQLRSSRDPRGVVTELRYNAAGDIIVSTGPNGRVETSYNTRHDPVQTTDANRVATEFGYDTEGNLTQIKRTVPATAKTPQRVTYDKFDVIDGLVQTYTNPLNKVTTYDYTPAGDLKSVTTPEGRVTSYTYDSAGRLETVLDPVGNKSPDQAVKDAHTTTYTYFNSDLVETVQHPTLGTVSYTYTDEGWLDTVTEPWQSGTRVTDYDYFPDGHVEQVERPDGLISKATYDLNGNLETVTDTSNRKVTYGYDAAGQVTSASGPLGSYTYTYDRGGHMATAKRDGTSPTKFTYNDRGQVTNIDYPAATATTGDVTYTYDIHGNRKTMTDAAGTVTYTVDGIGQIEEVTRGTGGPTFGYSYDDAGNIANATGPSGNLTYTYTDDGQLDTVTTKNTAGATKQLADYHYNDLGLPDHALLGNGTTWDRTYDDAGRLKRLVHTRPTGAVILDETYTLDPAGNPEKILNADGTTDTYTYDKLDRLTGACYNTTSCEAATDYVKWTYDAAGNRETETRPTGTTTYTYNPTTGQLASTGGPSGTTTYQYDGNPYGYLSSQTVTPAGGAATTTTYDYTEAGLLKKATTGTQETSFSYDGDGRRLTATAPNGTVTGYTWEPNSYLLAAQSTTPSGGTADTRAYQYGLGLIGFTKNDPNTTTGAGYQYGHVDPQGSIRAVTDSGGDIDRKSAWEPYGINRPSKTSVTDTSAAAPGLGWAGETTNTDGTVHLRARSYDPATGRFTTPDPAVSTSPSATYTYANGNPMVYGDPLGLFSISGVLGGIADAAPVIAAVAGVGAMVFPPLAPIAFVAGAVTAGISAYNAYTTCTSDTSGKGACGEAILNAVIDTALGFAAGAALGGLAKLGLRGLRAMAPTLGRTLGRTLARGCSFAGKTRVLMADGTNKPIRKVRVGDKVIATDPETGEQKARRVTHVWVHQDTVIDLELDGETITTTEDHPFWSETDQTFERADQLGHGERVRSADGRLVTIAGLAEDSGRTATAYNLTVRRIHTYHVGDDEILVHNTCSLTSRAARREAMRQHGIPTSMPPISQARTPAGYSYVYRVDGKLKVVSDQTTDRVVGHGPHWEAGTAKDPVRTDPFGRIRVYNDKSKVYYGE